MAQRLSRVEYEGPPKTVQSTLNKSQIEEKLKEYTKLKQKDYKTLVPGDRVRYFVNNEFRSGGVVKLMKWPDYFVLANFERNVSWSVQLQEPSLIIYVKTLKTINEENKEMREIYARYKSGALRKPKVTKNNT